MEDTAETTAEDTTAAEPTGEPRDPVYGTAREHVAWAKQRALEYCDRGDWQQAWTSMLSDLMKNQYTRDHSGMLLGNMQVMAGLINNPAAMRKYIEGFN